MFHSSGNEKFLHALFVTFECPYKSAFIGLAARKKAEKKKKKREKYNSSFLFFSLSFFCSYELSPLMHR
jgi:hypothetical protein